MFGVGGTFLTIKMRQRSLNAKTSVVNIRMQQAQESLKKLEEVQAKRKIFVKAALATSELIEPVPRSVILAVLTNELPGGTSLLSISMEQKAKRRPVPTQASKDKYQASKGSSRAVSLIETNLKIEGIAPSDIEVANYISRLNNSIIFNEVELVLSKEHKVDDTTFREFKLRMKLKEDIQLSLVDIENISKNNLSDSI
jgi:Tfp pilus assembly protein PilN